MGSNIELTQTEKKCYEAIRELAIKDRTDGNLYSRRKRIQKKLASLPLVGQLLGQVFLFTGTYPIDNDPTIPEISRINEFLAKQMAEGLKYEAKTPKEVRKKQCNDALKTTESLAYYILEKLTDEEKPKINHTHPGYFRKHYSKNLGNSDEEVLLDFYSGGQMDGTVQIRYYVTTQNPQARVYSDAKIEEDGYFTIDRTQENIDNREYIQSSKIHYEISPNRVCLPENTGVVIEELVRAVNRLYLSKPTKENLSRTQKTKQEYS